MPDSKYRPKTHRAARDRPENLSIQIRRRIVGTTARAVPTPPACVQHASLCVMCAQGGRPAAWPACTEWATGAAQVCGTCTHGYRPAGAMPDGMCEQGACNRHANPFRTCARDASTVPHDARRNVNAAAPSLTPFLEAMCDKSYNAPELIKEDLMCFFKFSRKGAELVGDLDDRMGKAELVKAMQEAVVAPPKKTTKKRKAPSEVEKEARGEKRKKAGASTSGVRTEETSKQKLAPTPPTSLSEEALDVPPVTATVGAPSSGKGPEQPPPFDPSKDSLVESPCPVAATRYICNMAPDRDVRVLRKARNADVVGHFSSNLAVAVAWGGEMHAEVLARLEELETLRSREEGAAKAQREALEAQLLVEREAHEAEKAARELLEAELEEVKALATREAERLKLEGKEEFLKSPEFDTLLGKKAGGYFKNGFFGCVAQWRANGYLEEEHPASFLNVGQVSLVCIRFLPEGALTLVGFTCLRRRATRVASVELGLCAELVGLMCFRGRATRMCQCGTGLRCRAGRAYVVEELRECASTGLGLGAELVGLMCLRRRATRMCQRGTGLRCRAGRAYVFA
ncbi:hypothetical protein F511_36248 [Dorcoceras hygrometricum]|uniref:Uncharacterized protein n=1 Tax=Dorcoceras hygrometricum TaxID=472368 RepID=A0A2Z7AK34_9LAMI|nr:hypothetical protein F511_36248 [Dorcoceras hygrometricum]